MVHFWRERLKWHPKKLSLGLGQHTIPPTPTPLSSLLYSQGRKLIITDTNIGNCIYIHQDSVLLDRCQGTREAQWVNRTICRQRVVQIYEPPEKCGSFSSQLCCSMNTVVVEVGFEGRDTWIFRLKRNPYVIFHPPQTALFPLSLAAVLTIAGVGGWNGFSSKCVLTQAILIIVGFMHKLWKLQLIGSDNEGLLNIMTGNNVTKTKTRNKFTGE